MGKIALARGLTKIFRTRSANVVNECREMIGIPVCCPYRIEHQLQMRKTKISSEISLF